MIKQKTCLFKFPEKREREFEDLRVFEKELIVRTCLSRINNEAVLGVFEKLNYHLNHFCRVFVSDELYLVFDEILRGAKPLDEAIQALHDKMLELVPEYREFLNNNK